MRIIDVQEAKRHLSRLVDQAARGQSFIIAKAGKPLVKVTALDGPNVSKARRRGFLAGRVAAPADFDDMGALEIERLFGEDDPIRRT